MCFGGILQHITVHESMGKKTVTRQPAFPTDLYPIDRFLDPLRSTRLSWLLTQPGHVVELTGRLPQQ